MSEIAAEEIVDAEVVEDAEDAGLGSEVVEAVPLDPPHTALAEPLPAPGRSLLPSTPVVVQAAAVAATGFVAGAATLAVARHRRAKRAAGRPAQRRGAADVPIVAEIVASRSFLVDVHLLERR